MCIRDRYSKKRVPSSRLVLAIIGVAAGVLCLSLIHISFDPRFNVVSLPFLFDSVEDADAKLDGEAGEKLKAILDEYNLHCMGIAENGFRQLTNSRQEVRSVEAVSYTHLHSFSFGPMKSVTPLCHLSTGYL